MLKNKIWQALRLLDAEDVLGWVGILLHRHWDEFPLTVEHLEEFFEEQEDILKILATSSLVGSDSERAIREWIDPDEREKILRLLED